MQWTNRLYDCYNASHVYYKLIINEINSSTCECLPRVSQQVNILSGNSTIDSRVSLMFCFLTLSKYLVSYCNSTLCAVVKSSWLFVSQVEFEATI
jgi:hypothetical protein